MNITFKKNIPESVRRIINMAVLLLVAGVLGVIGGAIGSAFAKSIGLVTALRNGHSYLIYLLPVGGLASVALYKLTKTDGIGTNRVIESAHGKKDTPVILIPVIFVASVITHLFGGSAGKEGAALQLGGGTAALISKIIKADDKTKKILTICGMAALFSAVFGTPLGAIVFAIEVTAVGGINLAAIVPAIVSGIAAYGISTLLGVSHESFHIADLPSHDILTILKAAAIAVIVSLAANGFCQLLEGGKKLSSKAVENPFIRIFVGGCIIIVLTLIFGTDYNGGGFFVIERIFEEGTVHHEAFLLKIIFTVITISAGYKGGEIVPSFFIGATLGATLSLLFGIPVAFAAAIGMTAFFGGVTKCPLAAAVIAVELFGINGIVFFAMAALLSRLCSGKAGLYQR
ncbi:MAG: chloride channel protein [Clostridia bacterium]|nr:chloride channel protein [Clostridia bacterium]